MIILSMQQQKQELVQLIGFGLDIMTLIQKMFGNGLQLTTKKLPILMKIGNMMSQMVAPMKIALLLGTMSNGMMEYAQIVVILRVTIILIKVKSSQMTIVVIGIINFVMKMIGQQSKEIGITQLLAVVYTTAIVVMVILYGLVVKMVQYLINNITI